MKIQLISIPYSKRELSFLVLELIIFLNIARFFLLFVFLMSKVLFSFVRKIKRELFGPQVDANGNQLNAQQKKRVDAQSGASEVEEDPRSAQWLQLHIHSQTQLHYIEGLPSWQQRQSFYSSNPSSLTFFMYAAYPFTRCGLTECNHYPNQPHWRVITLPPHLQRENVLNYSWAVLEPARVPAAGPGDDGQRLVASEDADVADILPDSVPQYRRFGVGQWVLPQEKVIEWENWRKRMKFRPRTFRKPAEPIQQPVSRVPAAARRRQGFFGWLSRLGVEEEEEEDRVVVSMHRENTVAEQESECEGEPTTCVWCRAAEELEREGEPVTLPALVTRMAAHATVATDAAPQTERASSLALPQLSRTLPDEHASDGLVRGFHIDSSSVSHTRADSTRGRPLGAHVAVSEEDELGGCGWSFRKHNSRARHAQMQQRRRADACAGTENLGSAATDAEATAETEDVTGGSGSTLESPSVDSTHGDTEAVMQSTWQDDSLRKSEKYVEMHDLDSLHLPLLPHVSLASLPLCLLMDLETWRGCAQCRSRALGRLAGCDGTDHHVDVEYGR